MRSLPCGTYARVVMNTRNVPACTVEVCTGTVRRDGAPIRLTPREAELVVALAVYPRSGGGDLAVRIWPDSEASRGLNLVKVFVHRVRRRVGWDGFIVHEQRTYKLGPPVQTDFQGLNSLPSSVDPRATLEERTVLAEVARQLRRGRPAYVLAWEWFAPIERQLSNAGHDLAIEVARAAVNARRLLEALAILGQLTCEDPCDEEARELMIRALLLDGNESAAIREYRLYSAAVRQELDALPSAQLRELFVDRDVARLAI